MENSLIYFSWWMPLPRPGGLDQRLLGVNILLRWRLLLLLRRLPFRGRVSAEEEGWKARELGNPLCLFYDSAPCLGGLVKYGFSGYLGFSLYRLPISRSKAHCRVAEPLCRYSLIILLEIVFE